MKKCTYCGKVAPDDATVCPIDGEQLFDPTAPQPPARKPGPVQKTADGKYVNYEDVPWYRREPGAPIFVGVLFCSFITIALCLICLTGDVYKKSHDKSGNLEVWSVGNKVAAVLILALQAFLIWVYCYAHK